MPDEERRITAPCSGLAAICDYELIREGTYLRGELTGLEPMSKILVVEDDTELAEKIVDCLRLDRYTVESAQTGAKGLEFLQTYDFDAVILDWQLPELTGIDIIRRFRSNGGTAPILMLTGRSTITDKEDGFDAGADDYLTKPFHLRELRMRVRALLRRGNLAVQDTIVINGLVVNRAAHSVVQDGVAVHLSPKEFALLEFFMTHPGEIFSSETLLERIWDHEREASTLSVRTHIKGLRQKLAAGSNVKIQTVHSVGYKLEPA